MLKFIPIKMHAGFTGFESPAAEYKELALSLDQFLIQDPDATYLGYAEGDSMVKKGILSGDLLIISRAAKVENGDVIVANLNGVFVCKEIDIINKQLLAAAPGYSPYTLKEGDEFQVEGVVMSSITPQKPFQHTL